MCSICAQRATMVPIWATISGARSMALFTEGLASGMARPPKDKMKIEDEPGAEQRFKGILKRVLNTPPPRKQGGQRGRPRPTEKKP